MTLEKRNREWKYFFQVKASKLSDQKIHIVVKPYRLFSTRAFNGDIANLSVPKNNILHGGEEVPFPASKDLVKCTMVSLIFQAFAQSVVLLPIHLTGKNSDLSTLYRFRPPANSVAGVAIPTMQCQ